MSDHDPNAPPTIDPELVDEMRARHNPHDKASLYYGRPDLAEAASRRLDDFLAVRGVVVPPPPSLADRRAARIDAAFPTAAEGRLIAEHVQSAINQEIADAERLDRAGEERRLRELREHFGPDYEKAVEQARQGAPAGSWSRGIMLSRRAIELYASRGRYLSAYVAAKSRIKKS